MKTPGAVYKKMKEAKFRRWVALYKGLTKRIPENCKYNYEYTFVGSDNKPYTIKLCMIHQQNYIDIKNNSHLIDVCQTPDDCKFCNGFVLRHSRDDIKDIFEVELGTKKIKETKYPEICALEWVLDRSILEVSINKITEIFYKIKNIFAWRSL